MTLRVLFVTHDASATGVPSFLLRLVRQLGARPEVEAEVLCLQGGPLVDELASHAPTRVVAAAGGRDRLDLVALGLQEARLGRFAAMVRSARVRRAAVGLGTWDVIYLNGAAAFAVLAHLPVGGARVLGHLHESGLGLERALAPEHRALLHRADRHLAVTPAVAEALGQAIGVASDEIVCIGGFVDDENPPVVASPTELRRRLGIPSAVPVVGAMGSLIPRKGPDLFVQLARRLRAMGSDAHLVWVGGDGGAGRAVAADVAALGLGGQVHLVGAQSNPFDWHRLFDVLVVPSREDPLPLVALEATQVGTPLVAFDQGGLPGLLGERGERGLLAPMLDVAALADAVAMALGEPGATTDRTESARAWVLEHHVASVVVPALLEQLQLVAGGSVGGR